MPKNNKQQPQQQKINVNIDSLTTAACPVCTNTVFQTNLTLFKKLPAIQSPIGRMQLIAISLAQCCVCSNFFQVNNDGLKLMHIEKPKEVMATVSINKV